MNISEKHLISISDEKVFETIFRDHYESLVHFARKYVMADDLAEEVVQEVFSNLWIKSGALEIKTTVKSYLFGAVRNACLNFLKHEKVKLAFANNERFVQSEAEITDFLELDELKERIEQAYAKIPDKCREIFEMSRHEGKKYQEIADELNLSVKTVENQMGKALKILREELKDYIFLLIWLMWHGGKL